MVRRIAFFFLLLLVSARGEAAILASWTELDGKGQSLRIVTDEAACPDLQVGGHAVPMQVRQAATQAFPNLLCQTSLDLDQAMPGHKGITVEGRPVGLLPREIKRILVLGDTGCRIKKAILQACNDPASWPFVQNARNAAAEKPDLVIHVGDYLYRETPCPKDYAGCESSPYGDDWAAWQADLFTPAAPLLAAAPWLFVRGNHEQCGRSANGWFRMLDAGPNPLTCPASAQPFVVKLQGLKLMVVDSADTDDMKAPADKVAAFRSLFQQLDGAVAEGRGWLVTHRPIWGLLPEPGKKPDEDDERDELPINLTEEKAIAGLTMQAVDMVLSGHIHVFSSVTFGKDRPAQLIVGNGGDLRDGRPDTISTHGAMIDGLKASSFMATQFGYLVLERDALDKNRWTGRLQGLAGKVIAHCDLHGRDIACQA